MKKKKNTTSDVSIETTRFGKMKLNKKDLIHFPEGIFGFENIKEYVILEHYKEGSPFKWLQAVKEPSLAFIIVNPADFKPDYAVQLCEDDCNFIKLKNIDDCALMVIITIPMDNPQNPTANFKAPIVVNASSRLGRQIIIDDDNYLIKQPLLFN